MMKYKVIEQAKETLQHLIDEKQVERIEFEHYDYEDGSYGFEVEVTYKERKE